MDESFIEKKILINASPKKVWTALTTPDHIREWASAFSEGIYVETDFLEGSRVVWRDKEDNIGATGIIVNIHPESQLKIAYFDDEDILAPTVPGTYSEMYFLQPANNGTDFSIRAGKLDDKALSEHEPLWEEALKRLKEVSEKL